MKADTSWFYIVISVIFIIISALGKNKKKQEASVPPRKKPEYDSGEPEPKTTWPKSFEDILTEVLEVPKTKEVIFRNEAPYVDETPSPVKEPEKKPIKIQEEKKLQEGDRNPKTAPEPEEKEVFYPRFNVEEMDLRQGIIYSEILNRKYF